MSAPRLVMMREGGRATGDVGRSPEAAALDASGWPSSSRALVKALSFIGTGISSSELSAANCWSCWDWVCILSAFPALADSLRPSWDLEGGRRRACLAEVLLPKDVKWLPAPAGVGDVAAILSYCLIRLPPYRCLLVGMYIGCIWRASPRLGIQRVRVCEYAARCQRQFSIVFCRLIDD